MIIQVASYIGIDRDSYIEGNEKEDEFLRRDIFHNSKCSNLKEVMQLTLKEDGI